MVGGVQIHHASHVPGQTHSNSDCHHSRVNVPDYIKYGDHIGCSLACVLRVSTARAAQPGPQLAARKLQVRHVSARSTPIGTKSTAGSTIPTLVSMFHALDALLRDKCAYRPVRQPNFVHKCTTPCTTPAIFHATTTSVVTIHVAEFLLPTILSVLNTLDARPCVYCVYRPLWRPNFVQNSKYTTRDIVMPHPK